MQSIYHLSNSYLWWVPLACRTVAIRFGRVVELVDEVVGDGMEGHLAGIPKLLQVLQLGPPSFLHSSPDMLNNIHIWRLCWPSLKDLDLLPLEKLHGFWTALRAWRPLRARIRRTVTKQASPVFTPPGAVRRTSKLSSRAVVLCVLPDLDLDVAGLLVALANPLHLLFRHIEDVCNFSRRLGLESWWSALWFLVWSWACWQKQCWALTDDLKFQIFAFIAQSYLHLDNHALCLFLFHFGLEIGAMQLRQDFCPAKNWRVDYYQSLKCRKKKKSLNFASFK